jgi:two-component system sensor histidine kinase KdpD
MPRTLFSDTLSPVAPQAQPPATNTAPTWPLRYGATLASVAAVTIVGLVIDRFSPGLDVSLAFVLPVILAAVSFGWWPSLFAAVAGVVSCDFFFIAPRLSLWIANPTDLWTAALLLIVSIAVSALAAQSRSRAVVAERAGRQAEAVRAFAHLILEGAEPAAVTTAAADALADIFEAPAVVLRADPNGVPGVVATARGARLSGADVDAAGFALHSGLATRAEIYPADKADYDFWPVTLPDGGAVVVGVQLAGRDEGRPSEASRFAEIVAAYLAMALGRGERA